MELLSIIFQITRLKKNIVGQWLNGILSINIKIVIKFQHTFSVSLKIVNQSKLYFILFNWQVPTLKTIDLDVEKENQQVVYRLSGKYHEKFHLDPLSGSLKIKDYEMLDCEDVCAFYLKVCNKNNFLFINSVPWNKIMVKNPTVIHFRLNRCYKFRIFILISIRGMVE